MFYIFCSFVSHSHTLNKKSAFDAIKNMFIKLHSYEKKWKCLLLKYFSSVTWRPLVPSLPNYERHVVSERSHKHSPSQKPRNEKLRENRGASVFPQFSKASPLLSSFLQRQKGEGGGDPFPSLLREKKSIDCPQKFSRRSETDIDCSQASRELLMDGDIGGNIAWCVGKTYAENTPQMSFFLISCDFLERV